MSIKNILQPKKTPLTKVVNTFASIPLLEFRIVRFQNKQHRNPKYRYWIAFRPMDNVLCVVKTITTQVDYIATVYGNDDEGANSVICIDEKEFNPPITQFSFIDCNIKVGKDLKSYTELAEEVIDWTIGSGLEQINCTIPECILIRIVQAMIKSPHTPEEIQISLQEKYKNLLS